MVAQGDHLLAVPLRGLDPLPHDTTPARGVHSAIMKTITFHLPHYGDDGEHNLTDTTGALPLRHDEHHPHEPHYIRLQGDSVLPGAGVLSRGQGDQGPTTRCGSPAPARKATLRNGGPARGSDPDRSGVDGETRASLLAPGQALLLTGKACSPEEGSHSLRAGQRPIRSQAVTPLRPSSRRLASGSSRAAATMVAQGDVTHSAHLRGLDPLPT